MKTAAIRIAALCMAMVLLLTGCGAVDVGGFISQLKSAMGLGGNQVTAYADMVYARPDMEALQNTLAQSCDTARNSDDLDTVLDAIYSFYEVYDSFYTNYNLAYIRYSGDLTDVYWEEEYGFCADNSATADAGLEELYYALADSPCREELEGEDYFGADYFDAYDGENIWDETFVSLLDQEAALENEYYDLSTQALEVQDYSEEYFSTYGVQMEALFVKLVAVRQEIAAYAGYDSFQEFAYDFNFARDYTPQQALDYLEQIGQELAPLYRQVNASDVWELGYKRCRESQTFAYVETCAQAMGGTIEEAFQLLKEAGLYDISYGKNKYGSSFEVFLNSYYEPFVFMDPQGIMFDKLTFAHEFGHFANDYACGGSYAGIDVAEFFSQGMEYLSLCYGEDTEDLEKVKLADCLCTYVEQAAYAAFEHRVYDLTGDDLTVENVRALYEQIGLEYGFDSWGWDSRDYVRIIHFFTDPMYVISYVVSNDAAFQIYQLEQEKSGAGLERYKENLDAEAGLFLDFVASAGLESPFAEGRVQSVRQTLEEILG